MTPALRTLRAIIFALAAASVGCYRAIPGESTPALTGPDASDRLIDAGSCSFNFGAIIYHPQQRLEHRFPLLNASKHEVRIVELVNRKPCCGAVGAGKLSLQPGERTEVQVILSTQRDFGEVVHEVVVMTEPPQPDGLVLRTSATVFPPIRIEEDASVAGSPIWTSDKPRRADFTVFAYGTRASPPIDLNRIDLQSTVKLDWNGPKYEGPSDHGLSVASRRFVALFDPSGRARTEKAEIALKDGDRLVCQRMRSWEVLSPVSATPKMVVLHTADTDRRVVSQSHDHTPFRIIGIECNDAHITARDLDSGPSLTHALDVRRAIVARSGDRRAVITVLTDHPAAKRLDMPIVVID